MVLKEPGWRRNLRRFRQRARIFLKSGALGAVGRRTKKRAQQAIHLLSAHHGSTHPHELAEPEVELSMLSCPHDRPADTLHLTPWTVGTVQSSKPEIPIAPEESSQQGSEQCEEGRCQAIRVPGIYVAFIYEVGWTGATMAERITRRTAGKSPGGGAFRAFTTSSVSATTKASRRAAGGGSRGQSSHRKLAERLSRPSWSRTSSLLHGPTPRPQRLQGKGTPQEPPTKILSHSSPRPRPLFSRLSAWSRL